jgi:hypothetical protein
MLLWNYLIGKEITDCFSFGVMRLLGHGDTFTMDTHLRQARFNPSWYEPGRQLILAR